MRRAARGGGGAPHVDAGAHEGGLGAGALAEASLGLAVLLAPALQLQLPLELLSALLRRGVGLAGGGRAFVRRGGAARRRVGAGAGRGGGAAARAALRVRGCGGGVVDVLTWAGGLEVAAACGVHVCRPLD